MSKSLRYSGAIALVLLMTLAGMLGVQALAAAEAPMRQVASPDAARIAALEKRVAQLETQLKALETKTKLINSDGVSGFAVHAPGSVSFKGSSISVESAGNLTLKGIATNVTSGNLSLNASGNLALKAGLVTINNGGKPAARQGDTVVISSPGSGQIAMGSPTVLIGN